MKTRLVTPPFLSASGYTLLELLISMVLGLLVLAGVFQINQANEKANNLQVALQQTQKNGRLSADTLSYAVNKVKYSGFYKSLSDGTENMILNPTDIKWDVSKPVIGFNNVSSTTNIVGITGFTPNTDVLLLKSMDNEIVSVIEHSPQHTLVVATPNSFVAGNIVVITDIDQASLVQVSTVVNTPSQTTLSLIASGSNTGILSNSYSSNAEIAKYNLQVFYIKTGDNRSPSLFQAELNPATVGGVAGGALFNENELVSNIEDMQITYGIDTDNDQVVNLYVNAAAIAINDWDQVISINIALLATSNIKNTTPDKTSFSFNSDRRTFVQDAVPKETADRRLKRSFTVSIPLLN